MRVELIQQRSFAVWTWWGARAPREQVLLGLLAAVLAVAIYVTLLWRPIQDAKAEAIAEMQTYASLRAELRAAGPGLATRLPTAGAANPSLLAESAARSGLPISRLEPGADGVRVVMQEVAFDNVVRWLDRLESEAGMSTVSARLTRRPLPGVVNAEVVVRAR